jgi:hydrogenase maturation protease
MPDATRFDSEIVVVGIGNIIRADDGAGVHALRLVRDSARAPKSVNFIEGGTLGLELLSYLQNARRILLLDAVECGENPGTLFRIAGDQLQGMKGNWSVHQLGIADLLGALALIRKEPQDIVLLGIQPGSTAWSTECSLAVHRALPALAEAALELLQAWAPNPVLTKSATASNF